MKRRTWHPRISIACKLTLTLSSLVAISPFAGIQAASAQIRPKTEASDKGADKSQADRDRLYAARAKAWGLFYAGKYEDAAKLAQSLMSSDRPEVKVQAAHILARCYWSAGGDQGHTEANKIWTELGEGTSGAALGARLTIGKALALQNKGKTDQAIELLEDVMRREVGGTATVEAAVELSQLYIKNKQLDNAKKALDYSQAFLAKDRLDKLEITGVDAAPFVKAVQDAKAHLKYDVNAGLAEWEQAEKLRTAKKYPQAIVAFQKIIDTYPDSDYAPHSGLTIGYCLVEADQIPQAVQHWSKFVTAAPSGPWRGEALVGLIDLDLEEALDLGEAGKHAEIASNAIATALSDEKAADSWGRAAYDIHLRLGIVQMAQGKPSAADHFERQRKLKAYQRKFRRELPRLLWPPKAASRYYLMTWPTKVIMPTLPHRNLQPR